MGKEIQYNQQRVSIYMEHGVKERGLRVANFYRTKLMKRYGTVSLSSLIKLMIVDSYKDMIKEAEFLSETTNKTKRKKWV